MAHGAKLKVDTSALDRRKFMVWGYDNGVTSWFLSIDKRLHSGHDSMPIWYFDTQEEAEEQLAVLLLKEAACD